MPSPKKWRHAAAWPIFRLDDRLVLMVMAIAVGICSGLAALALSDSLTAVFDGLHPYRHRWWGFLLPGIGAALSSLFLNKVVNEGAGHGVPEVIYSVSRYGGLLRFRSSFSRLISSCLTIGSGGSAGPEAPVVMSGSAIGSTIARFFFLNDRQRVTLVGCGAAGAISAIFNAPIAGLVFSIEVILGEWKSPTIVPIALASVAGAELSRLMRGNQILFSHQKFAITPLDILSCVGLAVATAAVSILLTRLLRGSHRMSSRVKAPNWARAALGGFAVGGIGMIMPVVLGEGYHAIQSMIQGRFAGGLLLVAAAVLFKILATSLTLGWGGSGGIFAPCLVVGSLTGLVFHRGIGVLWPSAIGVDEGCFALLGMAGLISGVLQAPLTGIFLIVEISGGYGVILPLILVSVISTTLCRTVEPASFYLRDLVEQGQLLRPGTDARVLSDLAVTETLERDCLTVDSDMRLGDFVNIVKQSHRNMFPVTDRVSGRFVGIVDLNDIRPYLFDPHLYDAVLLEQIMDPSPMVAAPEDDLAEVLAKMDEHRLFSIPVISDQRFIGMISKATLLDHYRRELRVQTFNE